MKAVLEQKSRVSLHQQILYFLEQVMHNDSVLSSISGLDHGGMVYLSRRHFSLTIYSWLTGSLEKVQLKLSYNIVVMVWVEGVMVLTCAERTCAWLRHGDCWSHGMNSSCPCSQYACGVVMCCIQYNYDASKNNRFIMPVVLSNGMSFKL